LPDEKHAILTIDRQDGDGTRMAGDLARPARAIGPLDRVDPEGQVAAAMEDLRLDDALDEIGPGGILQGRRFD
jgi:hypothetical protein